MSSNSVCNHTSDEKNRPPVKRLYDYRTNWTPLSPVTIIYLCYVVLKVCLS